MKTLSTLDPNETGIQITATKVIGTTLTVYGAWKLDPKGCCGDYSSITTGSRGDDSVVAFGRLGTERLPVDLDALRGEERYAAVRAWQDAQYQAAYDAIAEAVDLPADFTPVMGEIEVWS